MNSISIVLCTCNGARYLEEQLRTLRHQAGVDEIVVVDDGSKDGTWAILERHGGEDARLRLHRNTVQLGVTRNFERAISLVRGEWVALADQDDVWLDDKLARMRATWDGRACLLHHATHKFHGRVPAALPSPAGERRKFAGRDLRRLLYRNSIVGHTVLVRADVARRLMPFPKKVPHDWWIGVGAAGLGQVQYVDEYLVHYRIHAGNAFHSAGSRWRRLRGEHRLRLEILRALARWEQLPGPAAGFVRDYLRLLAKTEPGTFPWALWLFYLRHAGVFFGGDRDLSLVRRLRKSCAAALSAMLWAPPVMAVEARRPVLTTGASGGEALRQPS